MHILGCQLRRVLSAPVRAFASTSPGTSPSGLNIIAGVPEKHAVRPVRIFRPTKVATQQGRGSNTKLWKVQFEKMPGDDRWTNPLMGWTSTSDPLTNMGLSFPTKEAAIEYAERHGYPYSVAEPESEKPTVRKIAPFGRAMVHHWGHEGIPVYDDDESKQQ